MRTEWFAFFYLSYFFLIGAILPVTFLERNEQALAEFAIGIPRLLLPRAPPLHDRPAVGRTLLARLQHELTGQSGGRASATMVDSAGARTDAFPSLHTAAPTFIALHAFRQRNDLIFRWAWIPTAFLASRRIVISTMFLRWHHLIDVIPGSSPAFAMWIIVPIVARYEISRRRRGFRRCSHPSGTGSGAGRRTGRRWGPWRRPRRGD